jgi:uncharacterized protein (DUF362 family)
MTRLSRRDFLRILATGAGTLAADQILIACGQQPEQETPTPPLPSATTQPAIPTQPIVPTATGQSQETRVGNEANPTASADLQAAAPSPTPVGAPDLVVVRHGEPDALVQKAIQALGGMGLYVKSGDLVIIKPNICVAGRSPEYAATTNPWVIGALVKLCLEAGASKVSVMDTPFNGTAEEAYVTSGIRAEVEAAGGEMAYMPGFKYVSVDIPNGKSLRKTAINDDVLKANVLINVPIAKDHGSTRLTLGMKNLMGVIKNRQALHSDLGQNIADLTSRVRPTLTVIDAVRILMANGPTGGDLNDVKKLDTIIASTDIVAADSYAATLFGLQPSDIEYIVAGAAMGLGRSDLNSLKIEEINIGA